MALTKWDPFQLSRWPTFWDWEEEDVAPIQTSNLDIYETDNEVVVKANVPGITEKDLDITFEKGVLWIRGEAKEEKQQNGRKFYRKASRSYSYKVAVPGNVDTTKDPKAEIDQGVVTITFKKSEAAKPKRIAVKGK